MEGSREFIEQMLDVMVEAFENQSEKIGIIR
jgi:hypothetical protein